MPEQLGYVLLLIGGVVLFGLYRRRIKEQQLAGVPVTDGERFKRFVIAIAFVIVGAIFVGNLVLPKDDAPQSRGSPSHYGKTTGPDTYHLKDKVAENAKPQNGCKTDWSKCADNADMMNNYGGMFDARFSCKSAAAELAKYGTPEFPWLYFFTSYKPGNDYVTSGVAVLSEKGAKFQNGFGAMAHVQLVCEYDLLQKKVTNVINIDK